MRYIAIDPGKAGGIALIDGADTWAVPMPATPMDLLDLFRTFADKCEFAIIEKVGAMRGDGAASMFTFGKGVGHIEMAVMACGIRLHEVTPAKWMGALGFKRGANESKTQFKNRLKAKAQQLFPQLKITLKTSDALLIGEYARKARLS